MNRLPTLTAKDLERVLHAIGFVKVRQNGSHIFYRHPDSRTTTIPHHQGRDIARPLLKTILREAKIDTETLVALLEKI